ncbi:DUF1934 domain-containing protein [Salinithrix halophila]|uniref:DUF1934 domain-containing protein n=1 Tax=Salinithrix halophila TaxID=1485204 RepID=A0ABV8JFZ1_9BACL
MKPIRLDIRSGVHPSEAGGKEESIEQHLDGFFEERNAHWVLKYRESPGTPDEVLTTVKAGSEEVTVIRQGMVSYRQRYRPNQTTYSRIETPGGVSEMEVHTLDYRRNHHDKGGSIGFSFQLTMGGEAMGRYELTIQWTEVSV